MRIGKREGSGSENKGSKEVRWRGNEEEGENVENERNMNVERRIEKKEGSERSKRGRKKERKWGK